ncbi:adhesion G protein-coupled receptor E5 isoform X5 [Antechinus flavipes]|uniref:adhesion G protein-coupled receptor E5 isoform X5 n=1 Tax=Antechinus flavipes TaxID=38775 RepID=UPI0022355CD2|nr:adhesion G protein-coupled receptor E5 isoform X5 [Antechinus flavipes]
MLCHVLSGSDCVLLGWAGSLGVSFPLQAGPIGRIQGRALTGSRPQIKAQPEPCPSYHSLRLFPLLLPPPALPLRTSRSGLWEPASDHSHPSPPGGGPVMSSLPRSLFLGLCVLVLLKTAVFQNTKDSQCPRGGCSQNAICINKTHCACKDGFVTTSGEKYFSDFLEICDDVNECVPPTKIFCGMNADCVNTYGSYRCTCIPGYALPSGEKNFPNASMNNCQDINECALSNDTCGQNAECVNENKGYHCTCTDGYALPSGKKKFSDVTKNNCQDVDECQRNSSLCAPHGVCKNTLGSYVCTCKPGFAKRNGDHLIECVEIGIPSWSPPREVRQNFLNHLSSMPSKFKAASAQKSIENFVQDMEQLLKISQDMENLPVEIRLQVATYVFSITEQILRDLVQAMPNGGAVFHTMNGTELSLNITDKPMGNVEIGRSHTKMMLDWNLALKRGGSEPAVVGLFSSDNMGKLLAQAPLVLDPEKQAHLQEVNEGPVKGGIPVLLSAVSTAFLSNKDTAYLDPPVSFAFAHPKKPSLEPRQEVICAFWQHDNNGSGHWATTGCRRVGTNETSTTCRCSHLSSFAILVAHYEVEDWTLSVITQVGLSVSLVCLLLCILTFLLCRSIQGSRTTIHLHLCLCLFVGSAVFLAGSANPGGGQVGLRCRLVAGLLHYCFLAAFCWMCLEGLELYFLVVRVFPGPGLRTRWLCLLGYGTPALIVAISAAVYSQGYGRPRYCWLSLKNGFIWSFLGPITLIIAFNAFIFVVTVWKLTQKFSEINPDMKKLKKARMLTFTAIAQLCILGCTWIFGLFLFGPQSQVLVYIFTILNCFQGCFLFLLHCLLNKKVREEYQRWACIVTKSKYNEFSTSTTSQSRGLRPSLESGM